MKYELNPCYSTEDLISTLTELLGNWTPTNQGWTPGPKRDLALKPGVHIQNLLGLHIQADYRKLQVTEHDATL